jgi:hypothetical protein
VKRGLCASFVATAVSLLSACGGGGGGGAEEALPGKQATYAVGGTLVLNGAVAGQPISITVADSTASSGLTISLTAAGRFTFEKQLPAGARFELDVAASPGYGCQVRNGNRMMPGAAVSDIEVECTAATFSLGGAVSGLGTVTGLRLSNGSDVLDVTGDGPFTLAPVTAGASYNVTLSSASGFFYECNVANGSGSDVTADVSNVTVTCAMPIRATVSGLGAGTTGLTLNNGYSIPAGASSSDSVSATSNVTYTFAQQLPYGSTYAVAAVMSNSSDYNCTVTNGGGTVGAAAVNAAVACQLVPTIAVTSSTPVSGAASVSRMTDPTISFSTLLDASTVTNSSVTLISQYGAESVTPTASGNQITVTLDQPLRRATSYILDISTAVRGSAPNRARLAAPVAIGFSTSVERLWHTPVLIETVNTGNAVTPSIQIDADGNAMATWGQYNGSRHDPWINRYSAATRTWGTASLIDMSNTHSTYSSGAMFRANGDAMVLLSKHDGARYSIWSKTFSAAAGTWSAPILVDTNNVSDAGGASFAISGNGDALAVWVQSDGVRDNVWSNRHTATSNTWGAPVLIETDNAGSASGVQIAMNSNGDALAVWYQSDGTQNNMWANRYTASTRTWGAAALIESNNLGSVSYPQVVINENGDALAVWRQSDGTRNLVWANRYTSISRTWGTPTTIQAANGGIPGSHGVAIDPSGAGVAVWYQIDNDNPRIWSNRYIPASGSWGAAVPIDLSTAGSSSGADVEMDANGNALAVWHRWDGTRYNVWSNRYTAASQTWGAPVIIAIGTGSGDPNPRIAVQPDGDAHAVWQQTDGTRLNIWSSRFE